MSENMTTIARPYAMAAFEYALEKDALTAWEEMLNSAALIVKNDQIVPLLDHPHMTSQQWTELFYDVLASILETEKKPSGLDREKKISVLDRGKKPSVLEAEKKIPALDIEEKASVLGTEKKAPVLDREKKNFLRLLAEHKRTPILPAVASLFAYYRAEHEKSIEVDVISATALDTLYQQTLMQRLTQRLKRQVSLQCSLDPSLLGGIIVRAGDTVIDGSVRGKLNRLLESL
jgi:F-type H+-transporting ATPase subunit delta